MMYALESLDGERILPKKGLKGYCPLCKKPVLAKCGFINRWHWAHINLEDCDTWAEETEWHLSWKRLCKKQFTEVVIGNHRADIFNGFFFIELQRKTLPIEEMWEREDYYQRMIWLFDISEISDNLRLLREYENGISYYKWKWPRYSLWMANRKIFLDDGIYIFQVLEFLDNNCLKVRVISDSDFIYIYLKNVLKEGY